MNGHVIYLLLWLINYNNDDYYFENALNPQKAKERKERLLRRPRNEDKKEGDEGGENKGEDKGEIKEEQKDNKKRKERL